MYRDRTDGIVDLELTLNPVMRPVGQHSAAGADQHGLDGMVEVIAG